MPQATLPAEVSLPKKAGRAAQKEARPREIVDAALAVFAQAGFAGARLDDVAKKAGISKGTIYLYFDTKEDLFKACVRETLGAHLAGQRDLAENFEGDTGTLLREIVTRIGQQLSKGDFKTILILMISEGARFPELVSFYHSEIIERGLGILDTIIQRGISRGEFKDTGLSEYPMLLMSPVMMTVVWNHLFSDKRTIELDDALQAHLNTVLEGLRT